MCLQDKNNQTALHLASQNGHANIVGLLLKVGGSADRSTSSTTSPQSSLTVIQILSSALLTIQPEGRLQICARQVARETRNP